MKLKQSIVLVLLLVSPIAWSGELQFTAGANSTTYDNAPDAKSWGLSLRAQYNFAKAESGWIVNYFGPSNGILAGELSAGYEWKTQEPVFIEGGLGVAHSGIFGTNPLVVVGIGYRVSERVFLDFPVMLTSSVTFLPYIGMSF